MLQRCEYRVEFGKMHAVEGFDAVDFSNAGREGTLKLETGQGDATSGISTCQVTRSTPVRMR